MKIDRLISNAPGWPEVSVFGQQALPVHLLVGAQLAPLFERPPDSRVLAAQNRLFDDGVLVQPLVVAQGDRRTGVFIYETVSPAAASHFAGAAATLAGGGDAAVYYAPAPLPLAEPVNPLRPLNTSMFRRAKAVPAGDYAMWWSTPEDPALRFSSALGYVDRVYDALDGLYSLMLAAFVEDLGMAKPPSGEGLNRVALPEQHALIPMIGPEECPMFLCASAEKGLSLALPVSISSTYRDHLWKLFAEVCERLRQTVLESNARLLRPEEQARSVAWWQATVELNRSLEGAGAMHVGLVAHG